MFLSVFILVAVECKHDNLKQAVYFTQGNMSGKVCYVFWRGLQQEKQSAVQLSRKGGGGRGKMKSGREKREIINVYLFLKSMTYLCVFQVFLGSFNNQRDKIITEIITQKTQKCAFVHEVIVRSTSGCVW